MMNRYMALILHHIFNPVSHISLISLSPIGQEHNVVMHVYARKSWLISILHSLYAPLTSFPINSDSSKETNVKQRDREKMEVLLNWPQAIKCAKQSHILSNNNETGSSMTIRCHRFREKKNYSYLKCFFFILKKKKECISHSHQIQKQISKHKSH